MVDLSSQKIKRLENFGHSIQRSSYYFEIGKQEDIPAIFALAEREGLSIAMRGSGRSYGDAALNGGQILINFQKMNHILDWNPKSGIIKVEPGVTLEQLWKYVLGDGWWPPVVAGTMFPTLGGCLASNIHGKNNWVAGTIGEHVLEFEAVQANGKRMICSPNENREFFYAMIGGMGLLGIFSSITLQLKAVRSGDLQVSAWAESDLAGMIEGIDSNKSADYVVGWVDCTSRGKSLGRGQIHRAEYLGAEAASAPSQTLRVDHQGLPDRIAGIIPKGILHMFMAPFTNNIGTRLINFARYWQSRLLLHNKNFREPLVAFSFLLDFVPNWELAYGRGGLIQYQSFLPKEKAEQAFREILERTHDRKLPAYLGVLKRHRPDSFLLSHAVDGFSLALDFRVTDRNREALLSLLAELDEIVLANGGRFYFAKDSHLTTDNTRRFLGAESITKLRQLKVKVDPHNILQSDLYRRCFGDS